MAATYEKFIRDVKIFFFWYSILGTKNSIFFRLSFISRWEKLVQTGVKYRLWVWLCIVNALTFRWWFHLLLGLAILSSCVCSSSGAFLQQPLFGAYKLWRAEQSPAWVSWINDCCDDVQVYSETNKADIKRHPTSDILCGGPTDKPGRRLLVPPMCELKGTHGELKSDTHWRNWLCFQQECIESSNRAFTVQTRYTHTGTGQRGRRRGVNKGNNRGETGRGQLASALSSHYTVQNLQSVWRNTVRIQASFCSHHLSMRAEPSACFTRRVRLLLIIITLSIEGDAQPDISYPQYTSAVNEYSVYVYKLVHLHNAVLEMIFDFCESKTRTIKNFHNQIFENRLTTLKFMKSKFV